MDWNLKIPPSWDFTELEQGAIPNIDSANTSSSFGGQRIKGDFSVDLNLGQVIDSSHSKVTPSVSKMALSPSGSSKRARAINNAIQAVAACLVDGCNADLSSCREYHRRHKVCEVHSKTPQVSINGQKQRFCQQCSRFHSLEEFDEGKRSCRKRLDGHNRRRRKPQPDALSRGFLSSLPGTTMLQFSSPHLYPTPPLRNPLWTITDAGSVKVEEEEEDVKYYNRNSFSESCSSSSRVARKQQQFNLFHGSGLQLNSHHQLPPPPLPPKVSQPAPILTFETSSSNDQLFCDEYPPARGIHSDCALSLLSSPPSQTSCTTLSHVMLPQNSYSTTANPLGPAGNFGGLESIMVTENGMIPHHGPSHSHANGAPQTLPFYWE